MEAQSVPKTDNYESQAPPAPARLEAVEGAGETGLENIAGVRDFLEQVSADGHIEQQSLFKIVDELDLDDGLSEALYSKLEELDVKIIEVEQTAEQQTSESSQAYKQDTAGGEPLRDSLRQYAQEAGRRTAYCRQRGGTGQTHRNRRQGGEKRNDRG